MRYRGGSGGSGIIAEGESVSEGQTILSMPDTATMIAEISVHETEVDKVGVGQPASIVMDAFPDKILDGEVTEVGSLPDQQRGFMNPDLKVYKTEVTIDGTHDFLKSRMSCKVQILVEQLEDVLVVPIQVVSNRGGRKVVYVVDSGGYKERVVRTGLFNDTFVEIVEGLEEGEEVMLNPPLFSEVGGPDAFNQNRNIPRRRAGAADANDTTPRGQRGARATRSGGGQGGRPGGGQGGQPGGGQGGLPGGGQGGRRSRQTEGGGAQRPGGAGGPGAGQFQLTDAMADRILSGMKQFDPKKAEELEKLKKSDPAKFRAELMKTMQQMRQRMGQGGQGGGMRPGGGGTRQGQGSRQGSGGGGTRQGQGERQGPG
jgi:hypothetical protein